LALAVALVAGAVLRLAWVGDIEYKRDEAWAFSLTQRAPAEPFPWTGNPTSLSTVPNPGLSAWVFMALGALVQAQDPTDLARAVQSTNVLALLALALFAQHLPQQAEREAWIWATILACLNPLAVLFHRKLWAVSLAPALSLALLASWWRRDTVVGAVIWGLVGALLGQLHPPGALWAAGLAGWTLAWGRTRTAWRAWAVGTALGALPLLPWLAAGGAALPVGVAGAARWGHLLSGRFWLRFATEPFGLSLHYALGDDFVHFLRWPSGTWIVAGLHLATVATALVIMVRGARDLWPGQDSPTALALGAALGGYGILLTATALPVHRHYMIVTFPLMFVWVARLALSRDGLRLGRRLLLVSCLAQGLISAAFLVWVHDHRGPIHGDYGPPLSTQRDAGR